MGALGAGSALGMGGIVGALNGVIQTPAGTTSPHTHTTGAATGVTLPVNNRYVLTAAFFLDYVFQFGGLSSSVTSPRYTSENARIIPNVRGAHDLIS